MATPDYAELHCLSDFSFGRGASSAAELFEGAKQQGYRALAITDEASLAGIVRGLEASRATGMPLIVGSEVTLDRTAAEPGLKLVLLVENAVGYTTLCRLLTQGRRRSVKGGYSLSRSDIAAGLPGLFVLWLPAAIPEARADGEWLRQRFADRLWLAVELHRGPDDDGFFVEDNVGLAMRRLSIIDVQAGHQPLSNESGSIWIVYNGEIYNHQDLRQQLEVRGHRYRTHSDTESIVHLYEERGLACVGQRIDGKALQRALAHCHQLIVGLHRITAEVPQQPVRMTGARRARIDVARRDQEGAGRTPDASRRVASASGMPAQWRKWSLAAAMRRVSSATHSLV